MIVLDMREYGVLDASGGGHHDCLHITGFKTRLFVLVVDPREEPGVEAHLIRKCGLGILMAKGIDLPACGGSYIKVIKNELMAQRHLVDDVLVIGCGFIIHAPSTANEFELAIFDECFGYLLGVIILEVPPHFEKGGLDLNESARGILLQFLNISVDGVLNGGKLNRLLESVKVLIDSLEPTNVIV